MSTYFWNDPYVELLPPMAKLLYVYLCFNQHDNLAGVYLISRGTMAGETGLTIELVNDFLKMYENDGKVLYKDNFIAIKNRVKNNNLNNGPIRKGISAILKTLPDWALKFIDLKEFYEKEGSPEGVLEDSNNSNSKDKDDLKGIKEEDIIINEIVSCWNKIPENKQSDLDLVTCRLPLPKHRLKKIKSRLNDKYWRENWKPALRRIFNDPFYRGLTPRNEKFENWRADFDWFLKPDTVEKIMTREERNDGREND